MASFCLLKLENPLNFKFHSSTSTAQACKGKSLDELMAEGAPKLASMGGGGGAAAAAPAASTEAAAPAAAAAKKVEKVESEEEDDDMGFGLFD